MPSVPRLTRRATDDVTGSRPLVTPAAVRASGQGCRAPCPQRPDGTLLANEPDQWSGYWRGRGAFEV